MRPLVMTVVVLLSCATRLLRAQDASDLAAYRALTQTPLGALISPQTAATTGMTAAGGLHGRYGLMSLDDHEYIHNFGLGVDLRIGRGRVGATAGGYLPDCNEGDCPRHFMASVSFVERLVGIAVGRASASATLNIAAELGAGMAFPPDATLFAASLSLPTALAPSGRGLRIVPYLAPGMGIGLVDENNQTEAGLRAEFGAGASALGLVPGVTVTVGVHRVLMRGGNWLVGVTLLHGSR